MEKTKQEIDRLKSSWLSDPSWDIEDSIGFEDHAEELKSFRLEKETEFENKRILAESIRIFNKCKELGITPKVLAYIESLELRIEKLENS